VSTGNPFSIGFKAARANLVPGLCIQALMVGVVLAYYFLPGSRGAFEMLAAAKAHGGYGFSFASAVVAGAIMPTLFKIVFLDRGRCSRADLEGLLFLAIFWGIDGTVLDGFYRLQGAVFGTHPGFAVVMKKMLVDQFIYNPVFAAPYTMISYEFRRLRYRTEGMGHAFTAEFYRTHTIPTLCATWTIWIPVTSAIYALPPLLQIPLFALALTFWVLMLAYITTRPRPAANATTLFPVG
jgi:hypothetical protein